MLIVVIAGGVFTVLLGFYISRAIFGRPKLGRIVFLEKYLIFIVPLAIVAGVGSFLIDRSKENSVQSGFRRELDAIKVAQEDYFSKNGKYASSVDKLGLTISKEYEFYLSESDFPVNYLSFIPEKDQPFIGEADYQIFGVIRRYSDKNPEILIQPKTGPMRGL